MVAHISAPSVHLIIQAGQVPPARLRMNTPVLTEPPVAAPVSVSNRKPETQTQPF